MCGIAGILSISKDESGIRTRTEHALQTLAHRGPDDSGLAVAPVRGGTLGIGSVRLAILDLSPAGHMPMSSEDGRFHLIYNGEITNYIEVRDVLVGVGRRFRSDGDTEVLLQAWMEWGPDCLNRFEGMYAFAIVDDLRGVMTLARDAYGIKPLYYTSDPDEVVFSSELPSTLGMRRLPSTLDWQSAAEYLQWGRYDSSARSFVDGVHQLRPGHIVEVDLATRRVGTPTRVWTPSIRDRRGITKDEAVDGIRELFLASVRRNLRSDVNLGVALSGGIDSSAVAAAVRHLEPDFPLHTFSFVAPGFAESEHEWVDLMVRETGAISHLVTVQEGDLDRDLDAVIAAQGEPFASTSIYAQYRVFQRVHEEGVIVTLDGQGADELFAGYHGFPGFRLHSLYETGRFRAAGDYLDTWSTWPGRSVSEAREDAVQHLIAPIRPLVSRIRPHPSVVVDEKVARAHGVRLAVPRSPTSVSSRGRRLKEQLRSQLFDAGLASLLRHGDRNSMAFSVESRVPYLDRELTELMLSLPEEWVAGSTGASKVLLRAALRGLVPDAILDRRDKVGFSTPQRDWVGAVLADRADPKSPLWRSGLVAKDIVARVEAGRSLEGVGDAGLAWRLLNLSRWMQIFQVAA